MLYEQSSLDGLAVDAKGSTLEFIVHHHPDTATASLDRDAVLRLHAALGEWLYPVHTPEGPNRSLIEQMIERNVREQVAAILPLHLSTTATCRADACDSARHLAADPEPGDVGHPRPAAEPDPQLCKGCSKGNHPHVFADCTHCDCKWTRPEPGGHGRLMAELPRRIRPLPEPGCVCGHGWMEHYSSMCWGGEEKYGCRCTQVRPAPVPVQEYCSECEHSWARHGVGAGPCNVRMTDGNGSHGECGCEEMHP